MTHVDSRSWTAPWIWLDRYRDADSVALLARKEFHLDSAPTVASLSISANHIYRLYCNGVLLGRGPDRADPRFPYFDTYNVTDCLRPGSNVIVTLVYHCKAALRTWALYDGPGGVAVQLEMDGAILETNASWRMVKAEAWLSTTQRGSLFRGPVQSVDLNKGEQIVEALLPGFDDSGWERPSNHLGAPGELLPPPIPRESQPLVSRLRLPTYSSSIRTRMEAAVFADARSGTSFWSERTVVKPDPDGSWIVYDFGRTMGGFPIFEFECEGGGRVNLYAGESPNWLLEDLIILPKQGRAKYESLDWRGGRYIALQFRDLVGPVTIHQAAFNEMEYPFVERGDFRCADPMLGSLWRISRETARIGIKDHPVDCCFREQATWISDLYVHSKALAFCFGDLAPIEKAMKQAFRTLSDDGIMPVPGPVGLNYDVTKEELPWSEQPLALSVILRNLYEYSGKVDLIEMAMPKLIRLYAHFARYEDARSLLSSEREGLPKLVVFCGWGFMQKEGTSAVFNLHYIVSLQAAAELARAVGNNDLFEAWSAKAARVRAAVIAAFWDSKRCVFVDGEIEGIPSRAVSITTNAWAAWAGAVDPGVRGAWADFLRRDPSVMPPVSPHDASLVLEAFARLDLDLHVRDLLESYFGGIVRSGEKTLPEFWSPGVNGVGYWNDLSRCHPYGAGAAYVLPSCVLGIQSLKPGWSQVRIAPRALGLSSAGGRVPTPHGEIEVQWQREDLTWNIEIGLPVGVQAELVLPRLGWGNQRLWHNGNLVSELDGWPNYKAHAYQKPEEVEFKQLSVRLENPGRHILRSEV